MFLKPLIGFILFNLNLIGSAENKNPVWTILATNAATNAMARKGPANTNTKTIDFIPILAKSFSIPFTEKPADK